MKKFFTSIMCLAAAIDVQAQTFNFPANYNTNFPDVDNPAFEEMNGEIYFFAAKNYYDYEPHKYNCSSGTYTLLKDVNPGNASSEPYSGANELMKFKSHVYFGALDGTGKTDLWRTDGTPEGTVKFKTFAFTQSSPQTVTFFAADENLLYFRASTDAGYGIWRTDGTEAGTFLISQATNFNFYVSEKRKETLLYNGKFYFQQKLLPNVISLPYATDGTVAGTVCLIPAGNPESYSMQEPYDFEPYQGKVWYGLDGPTNGGLFKSDGTLAGTEFMGSCGTGVVYGKRPGTLRTAGNYLYVNAYDPNKGYELFYTDGTVNGGGLVAEIRPGGFGGLQSTTEFCAVGDKLFFTAKASANDQPELYVANGISGATRLDVSGPNADSKPQFLVSFNNALYFRARATNNSTDQKVYRSDGTLEGTVDAAPGVTYYFTGGSIHSLPSGVYFPATVAGDFRPANFGTCFEPTAVSNSQEKTEMFYPNPTQNELNIHGLKGNEKVWLMDFQGRTVLEKQMDGLDGKLNLSNLPNGMYMLGLKSGKREKIVKN